MLARCSAKLSHTCDLALEKVRSTPVLVSLPPTRRLSRHSLANLGPSSSRVLLPPRGVLLGVTKALNVLRTACCSWAPSCAVPDL